VNLEKTFAHLKKLTASLTGGQVTGLVMVFVAVVGVVIASAYWISQPTYQLLVSDMDAETASSVVARLKAAKVKYELTDGGSSVRVPAERVDELRLQFASGGLPSAGRIGFEIFDKVAFGTTEFLEHVNYRRALEGELARTISTLSEVSSARVHIAMAKDSLFVDQAQPAKASVVLKLRDNRPLPPATARGIASLVASGVESLRPESVTILDTFGRPLTRPEDDGAAATAGLQFDRQQQIERDLAAKVVAMLEPVVGSGRVRVNVSAILKTETEESTEERFDPTVVLRSRQTSFEASTSAAVNGGVAGARANQPPALSTSTSTPPATSTTVDTAATPATTNASAAGTGPPPNPATPTTTPTTPATGNSTAPNTASPATTNAANTTGAPASAGRSEDRPLQTGGPGVGNTRSSETMNYEVGKLTRHVISPQGQLARLSVAVILDDERVQTKAADGAVTTTTKAWEPAGLQRVQNLVVAAVGLDQKRGDQLTVENISFEVPAEIEMPPPPGFSDTAMDLVRTHWPAALRGLAILLLASFAIFGVLRPLARRAGTMAAVPALPAAATAARLPTVQELEGAIESELDAKAGPKRLPALTKRVAKLANDEPEQLARVVRGWIAEGDR
jgi:flagellar M-ring protein FliF